MILGVRGDKKVTMFVLHPRKQKEKIGSAVVDMYASRRHHVRHRIARANAVEYMHGRAIIHIPT